MTRGPSSRAGPSRLRRLGLATGRAAPRHRHAASPGGAAGPSVRAPAGTGGDHLAVRPDAARLRPESRGPATARVAGPAGTVITLRHAEVLEHGELGTRPLRAAAATDRYILRGGAPETWEPEFTFHGFRYAEVEGWPGELDPSAISAVVVHSDMARTGWFSCSHDLVNRLHENVVWGQRGNFLSVPTDCPQRDERLGWTGDIQVFAPTASFLFDCRDFLASWLADLAREQEAAGGVVPFVVPHVLSVRRVPRRPGAMPPPWCRRVLHERFGDLDVLRDQFASMRAWTDLLLRLAGDRHCGRATSSSATGSTRPPRRSTRPRRRPARISSPRPMSSAPPISPAEPPSCSATLRRLRTTPSRPRRSVGRSWPSTSPRAAG